MKVQCSIQEGHVRGGLQESIVRALNGNQLTASPSYEQTGANAYLAGQDPPGYDPSAQPPPYYPTPYADAAAGFTEELIDDGGVGFAAAKASLLGTPPTWGSLPSTTNNYAQNGYGEIVWELQVGLAKNTTGVQQPYFIAHEQQMIILAHGSYDSDGDLSGHISGVTYTTSIVTIYDSGIILPNQVIGYEQDINLPFPTSPTFPPVEIGNNMLARDYYVAVIGMDPNVWIATIGLKWGTTTAVS